VFGGSLDMRTFKEYEVSQDPSEADKIMHAMLQAPYGMVLMGADTPSGLEYRPGNTISVSLSGDDESELRGYYDKLRGRPSMMSAWPLLMITPRPRACSPQATCARPPSA
jgi:PhnB protein